MANAIKTISVQRGHDVTDYVLNSFGGAGGQHACLVADALGIQAVLIHPLSGVLSAYRHGARLDQRHADPQAVLAPLDEEGLAALAKIRAPLEEEVHAGACAPRHRQRAPSRSSRRRIFAMPAPTARFPFPSQACAACGRCSRSRISKRFGFISPEKDIEIEAVEVEASGGGEPHRRARALGLGDRACFSLMPSPRSSPAAAGTRRRSISAPILRRAIASKGRP